jgi:metal-responsive CopG/Arc/MetJ family transcriptional regulator
MRTTVSLDDDVAAAVDRLRRERHMGLSEAVNELIRDGLRAPRRRREFRQRTADMGLRIDVSNVAEALEVLEGPSAR